MSPIFYTAYSHVQVDLIVNQLIKVQPRQVFGDLDQR